MTRENLLEAFGNIDPAYISEAYGVKQSRAISRKAVIAIIAAAVLLAAGGSAALIRPMMFLNGAAVERGVSIKYDAKVPTGEELDALGGTRDFSNRSGLVYEFDSVQPNELFKLANISPLRSTRADYDSPMYAEAGFSSFGTSDISYVAVDGVTGKRFEVGMSWINTRQGLEMSDGAVLMMKNYETYTLPCGAQAVISLPDPDVPREDSLPTEDTAEEPELYTEEQLEWMSRHVIVSATWIWFTYDDIAYFIRAEHSAEEAKELLDSFS